MMPDLNNLTKAAGEPAEVRIYVSRFWGKKPMPEPPPEELQKKRKRGSAPGWIEYEEITDKVPSQVKEMIAFFDQRIKLYQEGKG
jgi:hypothetical protein